jgi:hypothetical protein
VIYRSRLLIILLAAIISAPFLSFGGTVDPKPDCPKNKNNQQPQEDSLGIYESENKVLEDIQTQEIPKKRSVASKSAEKTSYKTFDDNLDESDKLVEGDPNSAMSFNFIYYIIDKFKFTDPLE